MSLNNMQSASSSRHHVIDDPEELRRSMRREAQRNRRNAQSDNERDNMRRKDAAAHHIVRQNSVVVPAKEKWWMNVARMNRSNNKIPLGLKWNRACKYCGIKAITGERIHDVCFVCGPKGTHVLPRLPDYPQEWQTFLNHKTTASLSRKLNNVFTMTALGVHDGDFMHFESGISAVTLNGGRTYHRLLPAHDGQHAIRWFIHDPNTLFTKGEEQNIPKTWIDSTLRGLRRVNPFVDKLETMRTRNESDLALHLEHSHMIASNEIAAIISLAPASPPTRRKIVIKKKGHEEPRFLDLLSPYVEPLHYVLLLPHGTLGWSPDRLTCKKTKFSQARWYRTRFYMNAEQMSTFSRLTGEYLVDAWSAIEEARLTYIRLNQHSDIDEEEYVGTGDEEPVHDIRLPSTFVHSPAWSAANISDCLALRKALGPVTFFITFTTNPKWPEILSELRPGQTANDRPDLVVRVYQQYLSAFMKDIAETMGPILYHIRINEFQTRGLPHTHIAVAVKYVPRTPDEIDQVISAELPRSPGPLRDAVKQHMTHNHDASKPYHRCGWPSKKCQYNYPKPIQAQSQFNDRGYFEPRRREAEDANIVLHVPWMILKYDCHINTEYSVGVQLFQYLYKYFFKGFDEANWTVKSKKSAEAGQASSKGPDSQRKPVDEIRDYERGRYLSSIEAATRIASFHISDRKPAVKRLPVHLPGRQRGQMARKDGSESDGTLLVRYMTRPRHPRLDNMTYLEFGAQCRLEKHDPDQPMHKLQVLEEEIPGHPRMRIRFCKEGHIGVSRIQMVYPRHGDVFYLWALLLHKSARDWTDIRTVAGITHATHQEAARALGLFDDQNEALMAFEELLSVGTAPAQLRWVFAILASEGNPIMTIWEQYQDELSADIRDRMLRVTRTPDSGLIYNELLLALQNLLQGLGKTLSEIGLPEPVERQQEVDAERLRWGGDPTNLCSFHSSLTVEQKQIYDRIMEVANMLNPPPLHVDGRAGRGKTYLLYPVIGAMRKLDEIVLISAASAFAAKNYPGGRTAHYLYGIPVDEHNPFLTSSVRPQSDRARLLNAAKCHVIDEIGALHFKAFDCADRLMRATTGQLRDIWGGRMLITVGDFRQVAPVVRFGGRTAICKASLRTQAVFKHFEILKLEISMRQRNDPAFSDFLDSIGDDHTHDTVDLGRLKHISSVSDTIQFVFPPEILQRPDECIRRAILSPFNVFVDEFNSSILSSVIGESRTYLSSDSVEDDEGNTVETVAADPDFLNALTEPGIPPHDLVLKVGAICRFTRNFDGSRGLTKNTRVIVRALYRYTVEIETIPSTVAGTRLDAIRLHIPRINFHFQPPGCNFIVHRKQIPLVLCYATTFNGCQGLTVVKLALDLRRPVFSHGQLYSAMTRVPDAESVVILKYEDQMTTTTTNIVWKELLL